MLTPPVAIASYAAASIAKSDMWQTGIAGIRLAFVAYLLPFIFAFNPALLMNGAWLEIGVSCITVYAGGHISAEVLGRKSAYGGGARRWAVAAGGLLLFSATAIVEPSNPLAFVAALAGVALLIFFAWNARRGPAGVYQDSCSIFLRGAFQFLRQFVRVQRHALWPRPVSRVAAPA